MTNRPSFKREKVSLCNICRTKAQMTWDHVPPQGGIELKPMEQESVFDRLSADAKDRVSTISQNGVKYRTVCANCNNFWLGKKYDPALNEFTLTAGRLLKTTVLLPAVINVRAKPTAITRAILGHLLAAKTHIDDIVPDREMRSCFFEEDAPIPDSIHIFYWIYPYTSIVIVRDITMLAERGRLGESGFFSILKYFPIAYLVTDLKSYEDLSELTSFRDLKSSEFADIPIPLQRIKHPSWPEIVDDNNFILGGISSLQSSIYATPKGTKK